MPHAFQGAIMVPKCQELICDCNVDTWARGRGDMAAPEGFMCLFWSADVRGLFGVGVEVIAREACLYKSSNTTLDKMF